jgi:deazaflavin-dependent oxidoreductase (nitroreductase family)
MGSPQSAAANGPTLPAPRPPVAAAGLLDWPPVTSLRPSTIKALSTFHTFVYRATRGHFGRRLAHHDILLLTTTGRVGGRPHTVPLLYLRVKGELAVIASFGGHDHHPAWYRNLQASPRALVQIRGERFTVTAREATPEERPHLWALAVAEHPGYAGYQQRTTRPIPVVLLRRL